MGEMMTSLCPGPSETGAEEDVMKTQSLVISALRRLLTTTDEGKRQSCKVVANALQEFKATTLRIAANLSDTVSQKALGVTARDVIQQSGELVVEKAMFNARGAGTSPTLSSMANVETSLKKFTEICNFGIERITSTPDLQMPFPGLYASDVEDEEDEEDKEDEEDEEFELVNTWDWHTWYEQQHYVPARVS